MEATRRNPDPATERHHHSTYNTKVATAALPSLSTTTVARHRIHHSRSIQEEEDQDPTVMVASSMDSIPADPAAAQADRPDLTAKRAWERQWLAAARRPGRLTRPAEDSSPASVLQLLARLVPTWLRRSSSKSRWCRLMAATHLAPPFPRTIDHYHSSC